jgi:hypothetical protein
MSSNHSAMFGALAGSIGFAVQKGEGVHAGAVQAERPRRSKDKKTQQALKAKRKASRRR